MKLNKMKIARLTSDQAKLVKGGDDANRRTGGSTRRGFTCCWCASGENTMECTTVNPNESNCNTTAP